MRCISEFIVYARIGEPIFDCLKGGHYKHILMNREGCEASHVDNS